MYRYRSTRSIISYHTVPAKIKSINQSSINHQSKINQSSTNNKSINQSFLMTNQIRNQGLDSCFETDRYPQDIWILKSKRIDSILDIDKSILIYLLGWELGIHDSSKLSCTRTPESIYMYANSLNYFYERKLLKFFLCTQIPLSILMYTN